MPAARGNSTGAPRAFTDDLEILEPLCAVFRRHLKKDGQKYTPERAQVLDTILRFDDVFQVEELQESLKRDGHRVSKATIYRTIKLLQDAGIIRQALVDPEHAHYQLAYGRRPFDLLIRVDTNEITTIEAPELIELRDKICRERGLEPQGHRLMIYASAKRSNGKKR